MGSMSIKQVIVSILIIGEAIGVLIGWINNYQLENEKKAQLQGSAIVISQLNELIELCRKVEK